MGFKPYVHGDHVLEIPHVDGVPSDSDVDLPTYNTTDAEVDVDKEISALLIWDDTNDELYVRAPDGTYLSVALT